MPLVTTVWSGRGVNRPRGTLPSAFHAFKGKRGGREAGYVGRRGRQEGKEEKSRGFVFARVEHAAVAAQPHVPWTSTRLAATSSRFCVCMCGCQRACNFFPARFLLLSLFTASQSAVTVKCAIKLLGLLLVVQSVARVGALVNKSVLERLLGREITATIAVTLCLGTATVPSKVCGRAGRPAANSSTVSVSLRDNFRQTAGVERGHKTRRPPLSSSAATNDN